MKFTNGNWMMQGGVRDFYPQQAYAIEAFDGTLQVLATRKVKHRGDTLEGPTLDVRFSSPNRDVIRIQIEHFLGSITSGPTFSIHDSNPATIFSQTDEFATISSGELSARVSKDDWKIEFVAGYKVLTRSESRAMGLMQLDTGINYLQEQLSIGVGENIYGLGERFTAFVKNGQTVDVWVVAQIGECRKIVRHELPAVWK